mgnify:FL=1
MEHEFIITSRMTGETIVLTEAQMESFFEIEDILDYIVCRN